MARHVAAGHVTTDGSSLSPAHRAHQAPGTVVFLGHQGGREKGKGASLELISFLTEGTSRKYVDRRKEHSKAARYHPLRYPHFKVSTLEVPSTEAVRLPSLTLLTYCQANELPSKNVCGEKWTHTLWAQNDLPLETKVGLSLAQTLLSVTMSMKPLLN